MGRTKVLGFRAWMLGLVENRDSGHADPCDFDQETVRIDAPRRHEPDRKLPWIRAIDGLNDLGSHRKSLIAALGAGFMRP